MNEHTAHPRGLHPGTWWFAAVFLILNVSLMALGQTGAFVFRPAEVLAGEWWRLIIHPFVHVSLYHLALDGLAFLVLYETLQEPSRMRRVGYVVAAGAGSLGLSMLAAPQVHAIGLCGLSGIAHGLMAVSALEMVAVGTSERERSSIVIGLVALLLVVGKSMIEAATGSVLFAGWHLGGVGRPIAVCHAGGVLGALAACAWCGSARSRRTPERVACWRVPSLTSEPVAVAHDREQMRQVSE